MANGTDSDEFVERSQFRPGLKRELTFAMSQPEFASSLGRTRARKAQNEPPENVSRKRLKKATKTEAHKAENDGESENVKVVEELVEAVSEEDDAKSDVVDLRSDEEPRGSHVAESKADGAVEMEMAVDNNVGCVGSGDEAEKNAAEKNDAVGGEVIVAEKKIVMYSRSAFRRKSRVAEAKLEEKVGEDEMKSGGVDVADENEGNVSCGGDSVSEDEPKEEELAEKVTEDEMKNGAVDVAVDDVGNSSCGGDSVNEDEPKEEEGKDSESEPSLVKLDIINFSKKVDKVECEASEKPLRRYTRSALKVKDQLVEDEMKNGVEDMVIDDASNTGVACDSVIEDEPKQEELKKSEPEQSLPKLEIRGLIGKGGKVESEVSEKPQKRFTRSALKVKDQVVEDEMKNSVEDMAIDYASNIGVACDSVIEDEPKQEELKKSEPEQSLPKLEIRGLIGKGGKVESEVSEKPQRRFTRSALKVKDQVVEDEMKNGVEDMAIDDASNIGVACDSVIEDEPKQEELKKSEPEQSLPKLEILGLIGKGGMVESEASEKPQRRFTRSVLNLENVENEALDFNTVSPKRSSAESEVEMPKTVKKFKLSELLETGILEGQPVTYRKVSKGRKAAEKGLTGVISSSLILCHCEQCNGTEAISPANFELHAESTNKRPSEYIYLENGKTIWDVLTACDSSLETLEEAVQLAVGRSSIKSSIICLSCKGPILKDDCSSALLLCRSCLELKETHANISVAAKPSEAANDCSELPKLVSVATSPDTITKCPDAAPECPDTIPVCPDTVSKVLSTISNRPDSSSKCSDTVLNSRSSASKSRGKVTKKDIGMHKLVFEDDNLLDGSEVSYIHNEQIRVTGYKKGSGIVCNCCNKEVSPSQFEAHAGCSSRRKPYHNIFLSNGVSLHEFSLVLARERNLSSKDIDDLCHICKKGGQVIGCNSCPRVFHAGCFSVPTVPNGKRYCKLCQTMYDNKKDMENSANAIVAGRISGVDPIKQITNRCIRIVPTCDEKLGGCSLCSGHEFKNEGFGPGTVILCDQCEREFHVGCLKEKGIVDLKEVPKEKWFCHPNCLRIYTALQKLVAHGQQKLPESLLNVVRKKHNEKDPTNGSLDIKWRVLSGKTTGDESSQLLSKALAIFHDQFSPIVDKESGLDFIKEMLYGGTIKTQEFAGMYCAIVTVNESVVSAAMFRIYGTDVAELPLVATSADCQGQGYFQTLFSCIERFLAFLFVKILLLPAADEAASIWTKKFGFQSLDESEIHEYRKQYPIMIFHGTSVLKKTVPKCRIVGSQDCKEKEKEKEKAKAKVE